MLPYVILLVFPFKSVLGVTVGPTIATNAGRIRGLEAVDGDYYTFTGIPYALVDTENPFGSALPPPYFEETFDAFNESAVCVQISFENNMVHGDLGCLQLNIYVPRTASATNTFPVMVWIHGGVFQVGSNGRQLYGPKYLVAHNVIVVAINYRLGPYGFMCLDTADVPGNQGLKDQLKALRWIKENIEYFGGDTEKITLFGESAGSMSIDFHLISPAEKLYNNVIMISGNTLRGMTLVRESRPLLAIQIAEHLGYATNDTNEALEYLASASPEAILAATSELRVDFRPCVEKPFEGVERFLVDYPVNLDVPKVKDMPILLGVNSHEHIFKFHAMPPEILASLDAFNVFLNRLFDFDDDKRRSLERIVRQFYLGDNEVSVNDIYALTYFDSDLYYNYPTERVITKYLENDAGNVYYYVFKYDGGRNFMKVRSNITLAGASHSDTIGYLFDVEMLPINNYKYVRLGISKSR